MMCLGLFHSLLHTHMKMVSVYAQDCNEKERIIIIVYNVSIDTKHSFDQ